MSAVLAVGMTSVGAPRTAAQFAGRRSSAGRVAVRELFRQGEGAVGAMTKVYKGVTMGVPIVVVGPQSLIYKNVAYTEALEAARQAQPGYEDCNPPWSYRRPTEEEIELYRCAILTMHLDEGGTDV